MRRSLRALATAAVVAALAASCSSTRKGSGGGEAGAAGAAGAPGDCEGPFVSLCPGEQHVCCCCVAEQCEGKTADCLASDTCRAVSACALACPTPLCVIECITDGVAADPVGASMFEDLRGCTAQFCEVCPTFRAPAT